MEPSDELRFASARADQAKRILDDPLFQGAMEAVKTGMREAMFSLPIEAREQREFLFMQDKARQAFMSALLLHLQDHQMLASEYAMDQQAEARMAGVIERGRTR